MFARPALLISLLVIAVYSFAAWLFPYRELGQNTVAIGTALFSLVSVTYFTPALECLLYRGWPPRDKWASLAVWMVFTGLAIYGIFSTIWRLSGQPGFLVNNAMYTSWLGVWVIPGALILLAAPNLFGKGVPPKTRLFLGTAWALAIGFIAYLAIVRPDLDPLADWLAQFLDIGVTYGA